MPLDDRAKRRLVIDVLEGDPVDCEAPRIETHRERRANRARPRRARERFSRAKGWFGLQPHRQADQSESEREAAVQVRPERQQRRPEPRRAPPFERREQQGGEQQRHDVGSHVKEPVAGRGGEPGGGPRGEPGAADPPRVPRDQTEEHGDQGEVKPGREIGVAVVSEPVDRSPEPRVIGPTLTVCGMREEVGGWDLSVLPEVPARRQMPPEIRAIDVWLRPRSGANDDCEERDRTRGAV
jgi:hypothetical protein